MNQPTLIQQEPAPAEEALMIGNDGKARVWARRAVALTVDVLAGETV